MIDCSLLELLPTDESHWEYCSLPGDMIAIDVEAMGVLLTYGAENRLPDDPWLLPQIATALRHGLGSGKDEYVVVR